MVNKRLFDGAHFTSKQREGKAPYEELVAGGLQTKIHSQLTIQGVEGEARREACQINLKLVEDFYSVNC